MLNRHLWLSVPLVLVLAVGVGFVGFVGCGVERPPPPPTDGVYGFADGCFAMDATEPGSSDTRWLVATEAGDGFAFTASALEDGARFFLKATDLGTYLFYDAERRYLVAEGGVLRREEALLSDILTMDDTYVSPAEWQVEVSAHDPTRFALKHLRTGDYLTRTGLSADASAAAVVALYPKTGCADFPELTLDAEGEVEPRAWPDGDVYGFVETHSHLFSNIGFGGGGIFHGAPFHRLGVEHALSECRPFHGPEGRADFLGFGYDGGNAFDPNVLIAAVITGRLAEFNHHTEGYPEFTDWPAAPFSSTHQTQYYKWLERAWMGGLRLMVQHATSNSAICELVVGGNVQPVRYSCNDMVAIDRSIAETYALERYIDAQEGGPGMGWFRIVTTPEDARAAIAEGKLAVILGIEVSNLFDCFLVPPSGFSPCTEADVIEKLDSYHELGVRVLFPVHKYDNAFSAGDGNRGLIELGNFVTTGHWSNFVTDCPVGVPTVFDDNDVVFGGVNMPRDDYLAPPPNDMSGFSEDPFGTISPFIDQLTAPPLVGDHCQKAGLTPLGEALLTQLMARGMIIEIDHFSRRSYERAFEMLEMADYPAAGTHGTNYDGRLYALGGISKTGLGRCQEPGNPSAMAARLSGRVALITENGGYPAEGFGFDLNGLAGGPGPRFGERSGCSTPQDNPITYPFTSYAGDVTFEEPHVGNRTIDFNTEGMSHIGLMPELIEDARHGGVTDAELEPLFRSAEAYLRMWERAERRGAELR